MSPPYLDVMAFENMFSVYYRYPQKPTSEQLDDYGRFFPMERYIKLEVSELGFDAKTPGNEPRAVRYKKWLEIHMRALYALSLNSQS
jgi:hypothetical protein